MGTHNPPTYDFYPTLVVVVIIVGVVVVSYVKIVQSQESVEQDSLHCGFLRILRIQPK